jgi:hypothetical protein
MVMRYYDHYHDPNTHLQLSRQTEQELLREAKRGDRRPGVCARIHSSILGAVAARLGREVRIPRVARAAASADVVVRELRAVRKRLEALEAMVEQLH